VNSFSKPYPGAVLIFNEQIFRVRKARVLQTPFRLKQMEFGRIRKVRGNIVVLRMGNRLIELRLNKKILSSASKNKYVYPPTYYMNKKVIKDLKWQ
jgi:methionyl-tRNA formyltransferase